LQTIENPAEAAKAIKFLETMEENDDVQKVFTNLDIPDAVLSQLDS